MISDIITKFHANCVLFVPCSGEGGGAVQLAECAKASWGRRDDDLTQHEQHKLEASLKKVFTKATFDGAVISARLRKHPAGKYDSDRESAFSQQLGRIGSISNPMHSSHAWIFSSPMHAASTKERNTHHGAADKQARTMAQDWTKSIEQSGRTI